jgi:hypothetical protein
MFRVLPAILLAVALGVSGDAVAGPDDAWAALQRGGMVVIMRHASAPGPEQGREGDPSGFVLEDCATQRNLSDYGREQAAKLGDEMRAHHVVFTRVISSPWCRAKDTATQMTVSHLLYGPRTASPQQAAAFVLEPTPGGKAPFREVGSIPPPGGSHN